MDRINVLHIGSGNLYGGIEKVLLTLARLRQLAPGLNQHFAVCFGGKLQDELEQTGVKVHRFPEMRGHRPLSVLNNRRKLRCLQEELEIDVVLYHSLWSYDLLAVGARRAAGMRVLWMHDAFDPQGRLESFARLQRPDLILSNSQYTAQTVEIVYSKAVGRVIYYPVECPVHRDPQSRAALRRCFRTDDQDTVIIQSSRMEAWKGHQYHLSALSKLRDLPGWTAWMVGGAQRPEEKRYLESLKGQAESLGVLGRVRFLGHRDDVPALLNAADIHCQPNLRAEPFGIAFIEAMMAGLPLVTFRLGAIPELIDDSCGLLCEPGDVDGLAMALRALITNRELRERLGANGPQRARHISDPAARLHDLSSKLCELQRVRNKPLINVLPSHRDA